MSLRVLWPDVIEPPALGAAHRVGDSTLDDVEMLVYDAASPLPESVHDADVFVVWGRPSHLLPDDARALTMVRLVQGLMAGTEVLTAAGFADDAVVCSGVGLHDRPVAEHTLALVLALVRRLPTLLEARRECTWRADMAGHQPLHPEGPVGGKAGASLREHLDDVLRNRRLNRLVRDVELPLGVDDLARRDWDRAQVHTVFDGLEFRVLRDRLFATLTTEEPEAAGGVDVDGEVLQPGALPGWLNEHAPAGARVGRPRLGVHGHLPSEQRRRLPHRTVPRCVQSRAVESGR